MKQSVKTIVEAIDKKITYIINNEESDILEKEEDFDFGSFIFTLSVNEKNNPFLDPWDKINFNYELEVKSVTVTNENNKTLTNLSNEVFNQLELTYTNY